ncbi:MAG TPA: acetyl-CoA hydrolase/transferase C-terminal domain-containing protein [Spirochaetota bacterium]|nr:acetyl-CoA hydrolase/transferase C-terminal domain-containing protein [Spirochaetota bacterium]HOM09296.1 acetyl-CoA hydrolase/transferase C-terminal domain-containing protein [Spirochaetota bacterium]HPP49309.1 acetyl-CoA hydrolase/transferase C-terminal domain-containing protein [Spirochaetota bacterium]
MNYWNEYKAKLTTPDDAVKVVECGDVVDYGFFNGKPVVLDQALARRAPELKDVLIYTAVTLPPVPEVIKHPESFTYIDWQWSKLTRLLHTQVEAAYYCPILYHRAPFYYRYLLNQDPHENIDPGYRSFYYNRPEKSKHVKWIAMLQVGPMDDQGFFNIGPQNSETSAKVDAADYVLVEVNKNMPRCLGGSEEAIHISRVDFIVEAPENQMLFAAPDVPPTETDKKIAEHVMKFLYDGCCIQLGIGGMPNMVGKLIAQSDLKNLGGHTEMFVDAYVDMIESGRMNGAKKNIDKFKCVYTFAIGSQRMYDFMHNNQALASYPVDYTNDPRIIAQNDDMVSICNAIQVDLFSQVNAESLGSGQVSGNGGMWDFVLGSQWSNRGKSFICLSSTYTDSKGELQSRIVPQLPLASTVTIPRQMVDYIVTEFGAVKLIACPTWMRAEKLISIAHPKFQDDLVKQAEKMKIWTRTNKQLAV